MSKIIALDVDGVLLDFMNPFDIAAKEVFGCKINKDRNEHGMEQYDLLQRASINQDQLFEIFDYMIKTKMYSKFPALPGAVEAIAKIQAAGFDIYNVTAIPDGVRDQRLKNLQDALNFKPKEIICVGMGKSKKEALEELRPQIFIDDRLHYLEEVPFIYHLGWIDRKEHQGDCRATVDAHSHSILDWTDNHLARVTKKLDRHLYKGLPLQLDLKLESQQRKYSLGF